VDAAYFPVDGKRNGLYAYCTSCELEEASTHKSANTYAGNVFVTRDLDLCPLIPK